MDKEEIVRLLQARGKEQETLFEKARALRHQYFGNKAIVRGVIEITDACRMNCEYCPMRRDNKGKRYVMSPEQIIDAAKAIRDYGIKAVFLQGGETPITTKTVGEAIPRIRDLFDNDVEVLLCLGDKSREEYEFLKKQGADNYILKHETSDPELHFRMRHVALDSRLRCLRDLLDLGYRVGIGTIIGLPGQTIESIAKDILLPKELGTHMTSASPLIPAPDSPLANYAAGDVGTTLNTIALMRIVNPGLLIPSVSALEKLQKDGQVRGLNAGANVITVNFTPDRERNAYRIYGKERYVVKHDYAVKTLERAGLG